MVAIAAHEIHDGEVVFVGMRLPLIAFVVAKRTHAPNAVGLFENGVVRSTAAPELIYTMADPPNIRGATQCLDMLGVMSLLQSGRVHLGFLGAAEVDRFGNLNSTEVRRSERTHSPSRLRRSVRHRVSGAALRRAARAQPRASARASFLSHKSRLRRRTWLAATYGPASWRSSGGDNYQSCPAFCRRWRSSSFVGASWH